MDECFPVCFLVDEVVDFFVEGLEEVAICIGRDEEPPLCSEVGSANPCDMCVFADGVGESFDVFKCELTLSLEDLSDIIISRYGIDVPFLDVAYTFGVF